MIGIMKRSQAQSILQKLRTMYPDAGCTLDWSTPWQLLVATILSAQCTDARVNIVTKKLFDIAPTVHDSASLSRSQLEGLIHPCGTFHAKARAIHESARMIIDEFDAEVPRSMELMIRLRGVGRKTASVILSTAFGIHEGIAVDTHVMRVSTRLGLTRSRTQAGIERDLMKLYDRADWGRISHLLIAHGRAVCTARGHECGCREFFLQKKPQGH